MKMMRKSWVFLVLVLFSTPILSGQSLSTYRTFSLGIRLADVAKQVDATPEDITVIHQGPAVIHELTWWPTPSDQSSASVDPVQTILFSFRNGQLYKIVVTYSGSATQGLTPDDLVRAVSADYGVATMAIAVKKRSNKRGVWQHTGSNRFLGRLPRLGGSFPVFSFREFPACPVFEETEQPSRSGQCQGNKPGTRSGATKRAGAREKGGGCTRSSTASQFGGHFALEIWILFHGAAL